MRTAIAQTSMNEVITIRKPEISEWQLLKQIRLKALQTDPQSFGSSFAQEEEKADDFWINLISNSWLESTNVCALVAVFQNQFVGMIGCYLPDGSTWNIWGMFVSVEFRRMGIARALMEHAIEYIHQRKHDSEIQLFVNVLQTNALSLYKTSGFTVAEELPNQLMGDGKYHDEYKMILKISSTKKSNE